MEHVVAAESPASSRASRSSSARPSCPAMNWRRSTRRDVGAATEAAVAAPVDLDRVRPDLAEVVERHDVGLDHRRPDAVARRRATSPHRARERRRSRRRRQLRRVRTARHRRAAPPPRAAGADRTDTGRRARRRHRHGRRPLGHRDVVRLHRPRGNAGHVEPREEGPALRARGTHAASRRVLHRRRRRPAGRHRRRDGRRARLPRVQLLRASSAGSCRSSASRPATASPATPRCSAVAT